MRGQQINRVSGKILIVLSLIAMLAVLSGYTQSPQNGRRRDGTYFSAINRGSGADGLSFPRNDRLEAALAKRAIIGISSRRFGSGVRSTALP